MVGRRQVRASAVAIAVLGAGCIKPVVPPPTLGYGARYAGTGAGIYVKDSRSDWDITEGTAKITSEQALEASGDPEYEARRQIAREHNDVLYREGQAHRARGNRMVKVGIITAAAGLVFGAIVPAALRTTTTAEPQDSSAGSASRLATAVAYLAVLGGLGAATYGYTGGSKAPPYYFWHTPKALERPAYIREHVEEYNERIGVPSIQGGAAPSDPPHVAPGQRAIPAGGAR